jgi:F5/8 type C domain
MSKKKAHRQQRLNQRPGKKPYQRKTLLVIGLILCLGLTTMLMAQWRAARAVGKANTMLAFSAPLPTPTPTPLTLTKEYIYAGGRLVATEEPQAAATPTPTPTPTPGNRINFALNTNGGVAFASSRYSSSYDADRTNNGDKKGPGSGGIGDYWNDATPNDFSDELIITFNGNKTIDEIDLFCLQDNYTNPLDPIESTTTFTQYGLTGFNIEYWTSSGWVSIPNASVSDNHYVWRKFTFQSVTTSQIRVVPTASSDGYSRITELEAWGDESSSSIDTNVALSGTASASSEYSSTNYPASRANNGDRKGPGTGGTGDYWNDASSNSFPDSLQIDFGAQKTIRRIDLFMLQDTYWAPSVPDANMSFLYYGLRDFEVQYWNGASWVTIPNGTVTNNNKVWRSFRFPNISTDKIRVLVTGTPDGWSRLTELEAWGN